MIKLLNGIVCALNVRLVESDPHIPWGVLLHPDFLQTAHASCYVLHLLFDVNEKGGILLQIDLERVEHVVQENTVRGLRLHNLLLRYRSRVVNIVLALNELTSVVLHRSALLPTQLLHE